MQPRHATAAELSQADGTMPLLKIGGVLLVIGIVCCAIVELALGGVHHNGVHGNLAWGILVLMLFSLSMGAMLFVLGGAKWLRNQRLARRG